MIPQADYVELQQIYALYAHIVDDRLFSRIEEVFAADAEFDFTAVGGEIVRGAGNIAATIGGWPDLSLIHLVANLVATPLADDTAEVRSRALVSLANGTVSSTEYEDIARRTAAGWRIARRKVKVRGARDS